MEVYNGPFLTDEGFVKVQIEVEKDEIKNYEEGGDEGKDAIVIPSFFNAHTHIGDSIVKKPPKGNIEEVVGPGGKKHEVLSTAGEMEKIEAMEKFLHEMSSVGVKHFLDFREGGMEGLKLMKRSMDHLEEEIRPVIMSRPEERRYDSWELNQILSMADGIGLSAYRDWNEDQIKKISTATKNKGKPFALHCSEDVREPVEEILDLSIDHLVHMIEADKSDLEMCAEEEIPIVVCPRSNMFFGKMPDIPEMLDSGLSLSLGTDNAMISNGNMFREMETAYRIGKFKGEVSALEVLMMSTWNPRNDIAGDSLKVDADHFLILEHKDGEPASNVVLNSTPRDIIKTVRWENGKV